MTNGNSRSKGNGRAVIETKTAISTDNTPDRKIKLSRKNSMKISEPADL